MPADSRTAAPQLMHLWRRFGLLLVTGLFWAAFGAFAEGFLSSFNLFSLLRLAAIQIVIGFAQLITLSAGEMNLAVGAIGGGVGMFVGALMQLLLMPALPAVLLGIALGFLAGWLNGWLSIVTRVESFIITLASGGLFTGLMLILTRAKSFNSLPPAFVEFSRLPLFGLPVSPFVPIMLAVAAGLYFLYRNTRLGRELLAVGANRHAARMSGLRVERILLTAHGLSGALAGLAAVMMISMLGTAAPVVGTDWVLASFVAPAIGGTLLSGGEVSVFGTVLGGVLVGTVTSGLPLLEINSFWLNLFLGVVLLVAVGLDRISRGSAAGPPLAAVVRGAASKAPLGLLAVNVVGVLILIAMAPAFLSAYNLYVLARDIAVMLLVALSQMVVIAVGQMNLSVGSIGGLVVVVVGGLMARHGLSVPAAVAAGLLVGVLAGAANGLLVRWTQINSFVLTLATGYVFLGVNLGITHAVPFYKLPVGFAAFGQARVSFFPLMALVTIPVVLALAFLLKRMVLGRQILAVGGNARAAELSGLPAGRAVIVAHGISGLLAAIAAVLVTAQLGSAQPTIGATWVLPSFAGPIIGGAALAGGTAPILGTAMATALIALINNALVLLNADPYWVQFLVGAMILVAVVLGGAQIFRARRARHRPAPGAAAAAAPVMEVPPKR